MAVPASPSRPVNVTCVTARTVITAGCLTVSPIISHSRNEFPIKKGKTKKKREKIFPEIFRRLVSRARAVKRKFSNCQHTSSDGPSGTKFNFPTMTAHPSLGIATARHPFVEDHSARARARYRIRQYIRRRNTLCPRKIPNVRRRIERREEERGAISVSRKVPSRHPANTHSRTYIHTRAYVKPRLKFRLLDPR